VNVPQHGAKAQASQPVTQVTEVILITGKKLLQRIGKRSVAALHVLSSHPFTG
jgi:hypothetical protein